MRWCVVFERGREMKDWTCAARSGRKACVVLGEKGIDWSAAREERWILLDV